MDNISETTQIPQNQPQQAVMPPVQPVAPQAPAPIISSGPPSIPPVIIIIAIAAVILVILGIVGLTAIKPQRIVAVPTPTPSVPPPTPTPARTLSPLATQSAFLQFEQSVASLSAGVAAYNVQDQTFTPPVLVLPLGFTQ